jgi:TonB-dependent receptor
MGFNKMNIIKKFIDKIRSNIDEKYLHLKKMSWLLNTGLLILIITGVTSISFGQSGSIIGSVTDSQTGKTIDGVNVTIQGVTRASVSDRAGRFAISGVPLGSQKLLLKAPGYTTLDTTVSIGSSIPSVLNIQLVPDFIETEDRYVYALRSEQIQAYTRRKHSSNMGHTISSSQMIRDGDYTIQTGLTRVPGVQVGRRGELNIRGVGRNMFEVTVDGQRVASSSPGNRFTDPGSFSAALAHDVEIVKVLSPDMDAEGIGGVVRINTWRPVGNRELTVHAGGMANPRYNRYTGLGSLASIGYSERFSDEFSMAVNISYQRDVNGFDGLEIDYGSMDFGDGYVDVLERLAPGMSNTKSDFIGSSIQFSYKPNEMSSFYLQGLMNVYDNKNERHRYIYASGNDWIDQNTTGNTGRQGSHIYDASFIDGNKLLFNVHAGGQHTLHILNVQYRVGWSNSSVDNSSYYFPFISSNLDYEINMSDRTRPSMIITNTPLMEDGSLDRRMMNFQHTERVRDEHEENRYSARLDFNLSLGNASVRFGTSGLWTSKGRGYSDAGISTIRRYDLMRFETVPRGSFDAMDKYAMPWIIYPENVASFINTNKPDLRMDAEDMIKRSEIWNNNIFESIYGAYGMITMDFGRLEISGGLRMEYTDGVYDGSKVIFNQFDTFISSADTSATVRHTHLFPNARIKLSPAQNTNLKLAYSRSIKRHHYSMLVPFELISAVDRTRFWGNPNLAPVLSDNLDIMFEQYLAGIGVFTAGAFYKELSNLAYLQERTVSMTGFPFHTVPEGETIETTERTYQNSNEPAIIYGLEVSWQQYLGFLPGFLGNFGVYANYSWTHSVDERLNRNGDELALLHQSPHAVNASLDYYQGRFSGSIAWHWSAASLYRLASEEQWAPAVDKSEPIYLDWYEEGWTDMSASFGFRISSNFRFWANAKNLLGKERIVYGENRALYPFSTDLNSGFRLTAGLTFTM